MADDDNELPKHIASLLQPEPYDHPVDKISLIETHISWVILTGLFAYKIKKPVNLGFLDFSTLKQRQFYCNEELRLNKRLAPTLYLDVIPITRSNAQIHFNGTGDVIDYAIKMVQFPQQVQCDRLLETQQLNSQHIDALAAMVADFHQQTPIANKDDSYGELEQIFQPIEENVTLLKQLIKDKTALEQIENLAAWSQSSFEKLKPVIIQRKQLGFIRECHGDLHLANLIYWDNKPLAFDCIEFDPTLRWIDTINDIAFLIMDLQARDYDEFAQHLLNSYLEQTGDYAGIQLVRFYLVYRAMVRAKVEAIRASQTNSDKTVQRDALTACYHYLTLAEHYLYQIQPTLLITCGMSASGKSTLTQSFLEKLPAIRVRSDVERKRLFQALDSTELYSAETTLKTYRHLAYLAQLLLSSGYSVIVDATFLQQQQRELFQHLAVENTCPFVILHFTAKADVLRQRIMHRSHDISDADLSVLEQQLSNGHSFCDDEHGHVLTIDTEAPISIEALIKHINQMTS